ncbi:putative FBD-associated F-box protein At5g56700 isoform X2 [Papaver somniferum]|uniref:putative FBD-associated F-box protein At5g56700 isoform X2 n=1 Tax=Papaver somniferum TaxID=3469 RepID=UPI000E6F48DD|nr:putative FBD-associated F-box protein At5g56700 isoform X2 [Papaver somniferum]
MKTESAIYQIPLNFDPDAFKDLNVVPWEKFINFVDKVLTLRDNSDIQKFHLKWDYMNDLIPRHLNTWITASIKRNVHEISVDVDCGDLVLTLPNSLFSSKSLTKLVLKFGGSDSDITLPSSMSLPRLTSLSLCSFRTKDVNLVNELISSCPVLESLLIRDFLMEAGDDSIVIIESSGLKHLEICNDGSLAQPHYNMAKIIKLVTPNLTSFICKDYMLQEYYIQNLSSLVTADIKLREVEDGDVAWGEEAIDLELSAEVIEELFPKRIMKFLRALHNVLSQVPNLLGRQPAEFCNLQLLKLETCLTIGCLCAITYLLKISPNIESLFLTSKEWNLADVDDWEVTLSSPHMFSHLKYIEFREVYGCQNEFRFLEFLFKNAAVLEEVVLFL